MSGEKKREPRRETVFVTLYWARLSLDDTTFEKGAFPLSTGISRIIDEYHSDRSYPKGIRNFGCHPRRVKAIAVTKDGLHGYSASLDGTVIHWDLIREKQVHEWQAHSYGLQSMAYESGYLVSGGTDLCARVWDAESHECIRHLSTDRLSFVGFGRSAQTVIIGTQMGTVQVWEVKSGRKLNEMSYNNRIQRVLSIDDGIRMVIATQDSITIRGKREIREGSSNLNDISINCDVTLIANCGDSMINIRSHPECELIRSIDEGYARLQFHPLNPTILAAASNSKLVLMDVSEGRIIRTFRTSYSSSTAVAFTPDGSRLMAGMGASLRMYDLSGLVLQ